MVTFLEAKAQRIAALQAAIADVANNNYDKNVEFLWQQLSTTQSGSTGGGGGGTGTSPEDIVSGIDNSVDIDSILGALAGLLTELEGKADLTEIQPVSLASQPLPTDAATSELQTSLIQNVGAKGDTAATTATGTSSLIALFKRLMAHFTKPRTTYGVLISSINDNPVLPAIDAATEYVITGLRIQAATSNITTVLLKKGASDPNPLRLRTVADGGGMSDVYGFAEGLHWGGNTAFILNLSAANAHGVSVIYYLASVSTGLPT